MRIMAMPAMLLLVLIALAGAIGGQNAPFSDPFVPGPGVGPTLIAIPALETGLGAPPQDPEARVNEQLHHVVLSPYAIGAHEVTSGEFSRFLNDAGNARERRIEAVDLEVARLRRTASGFVPIDGTANRPIVGVTWAGARAYCRWLSFRTGRHYDLPTAAQWEAAARAGSRDPWHWGAEEDASRYRSAADERLSAADTGSYAPNGWGIHDTAGNVWEWVLDCYDPNFALYAPERDPVLRDDACGTPEIRGGSFRDGGYLTRAAFRVGLPWSTRVDNVGFRVARRIEPGER